MSHSVEQHAADHGGGIHLPKPSFTPLIWAAGFMLIAFGIITGGTNENLYWLAAAGLGLILIATGGWLWGNIRERIHGSETPEVAAKFAMWCFLGTEIIIFGALIARVLVIWIHEPEAHTLLTHPVWPSLVLVSVNTFLLLTSSWAMVMGLRQIQRNNVQGLVRWLGLTALLGTVFILLQYVEYRELAHIHVTLGYDRDAFNGFGMHFYVPTSFHGAHVFVGVLWCLLVMRRATKGRYSARNYVGVEVFGLYWHFVDVVWILLFTLIYLV